MSEALYTHYAMSSDGELTVLGYAYGEPWVEQALYMDDMRYPTPEAAKAAWEAFLEVTKADVRTPSPELVKQMQGKDLWIGNEAFAKCMEGEDA